MNDKLMWLIIANSILTLMYIKTMTKETDLVYDAIFIFVIWLDVIVIL